MFKKLKEKSKIAFFCLVLATLLLSVMGGFMLPSGTAQARSPAEGANCTGSRDSSTGNYAPGQKSYDGARVCDPASITVTTNTSVNGTPGNFVIVGPSDSINFSVKVTLNAPTDLNVLDASSTSADYIYFSAMLSANPPIAGFGASVTAQDTTTFCGQVGTNGAYFKCDSNGEVGSSKTVGSSKISISSAAGSYDKYKLYSSLTNVTAGNSIFEDSFSISPNDFARYGITNTGNATSSLHEILVYPDLVMNFATADDWLSFKAASPIFVQLYSDETAAQAAIANNTPPPTCQGATPNFGKTSPITCVPGYSSQTGSGISNTSNNALLGFLNSVIGIILGFLQEFIFLVFYWLLAPMIQAMLSIHTYTDTFVGVIYPAWVVVRNACNIMFIIAIIAIAAGTMFRVESYQYKHLLVQLIIAALLVNFSLVIGQAVLGLADTVQNQFLPNNADVIRSLGKDMMVGYRDTVYGTDFQSQGNFSDTVKPLFFLSLAIGSFAVFAAIAAFLVIRIVALWILLMISPIAYVAGVLPNTTKYREEWWTNFVKYAFFTPIMAFMLNIAAYIAKLQETNPVLVNLSSAQLGNSDFATFVFKVASNLILLVFLFAALMVSDKLGVYGGKFASDWGKKAMLSPFTLSAAGIKAGTGYGLEKLHEKTGIQLNPQEWIEGWKHSREENKAKRKILGQSLAEEKGIPFGNPTSFFQRYWNPHTVGRLGRGGNFRGKRNLKKAQEMEEDYKKRSGSMSEKEKEEFMVEYRKKMHLAHALMAPVDYHTQKEFRGKTDEEKNKIHTKNWHELFSLFQAAKEEHEPLRAAGILKKVTETFNENEFINSSFYHRNMAAKESAEWTDPKAKAAAIQKQVKAGMSQEEAEKGDWTIHKQGEHFKVDKYGADNFRQMVLKEELGLGEQASMQLMNDVSDMCEDTNHRVLMRMYGERGGKLYLKTDKERDPEIRAENNKLNSEKMLNFCNRLGGYIEIPADDYEITGNRYSQITGPMLAYYIEHSSDIEPMVRRGRINSSQAKSFAENYDEIMEAAKDVFDDKRKIYEDPNHPNDPKADPATYKFYTKFELFADAMKLMKEKGQDIAEETGKKSIIEKSMEAMPGLEAQIDANRAKKKPTT